MALALLLGTFLATTSFAGIKDTEAKKKENRIKVERKAGSKYELTYLTIGEGSVRINIYDQKGIQLHSERIDNISSFTKSFDFRKLPDGEYAFEIMDETGKISTAIHHIVKNRLKAEVTVLEADKYRVLVRGSHMAPVMVNIYDSRYELIYTDEVKIGKSFTKVYDLSKVRARNLVFEVSENGKLISRRKF